jgi:hypothetical protein
MGLANMCQCLQPRSALGCHVDFYIPTGFTTPIDQFFLLHAGSHSAEKTQFTLGKSMFFQKILKGAIICHIKRTFPPTSKC